MSTATGFCMTGLLLALGVCGAGCPGESGDTAVRPRPTTTRPLVSGDGPVTTAPRESAAALILDSRAETITEQGRVRLDAVENFSYRGMTIDIRQALPEPGVEYRWQAPTVTELLALLEAMKLTFADKVAVIQSLHRAGKLHGELIFRPESPAATPLLPSIAATPTTDDDLRGRTRMEVLQRLGPPLSATPGQPKTRAVHRLQTVGGVPVTIIIDYGPDQRVAKYAIGKSP